MSFSQVGIPIYREKNVDPPFAIVRKFSSLLGEVGLVTPIIIGLEKAELEPKDIFNITLEEDRINVIRISKETPAVIDFENARCVNFRDINFSEQTWKKVGNISSVESQRIQNILNGRLANSSTTLSGAYKEFLDAMDTLMSGDIPPNTIWGKIHRERRTPQKQKSQELAQQEDTRQKIGDVMEQGIPLTNAIDIVKFGRKIPETPSSSATSYNIEQRKDILDTPFQTLVDRGLFTASNDEIIDFQAFLKNPMFNDLDITAREVLENVTADPNYLIGRYRSVGTGLAPKIAQKIISILEKYSDDYYHAMPLYQAVEDGYISETTYNFIVSAKLNNGSSPATLSEAYHLVSDAPENLKQVYGLGGGGKLYQSVVADILVAGKKLSIG